MIIAQDDDIVKRWYDAGNKDGVRNEIIQQKIDRSVDQVKNNPKPYDLKEFPLIYTLCFLYREEQVLMLLRNNPPNQGLWNGVGGHLENGESPLAGCLREVQEETGYHLQHADFRGLLTWQGYEVPAGGLYIFSAAAPPCDPIPTTEGMLDWKPYQWIFSAPEVVGNIHLFGPEIFQEQPPRIHHFVYEKNQIMSYQRLSIPREFGLHDHQRRI